MKRVIGLVTQDDRRSGMANVLVLTGMILYPQEQRIQ